MKSVLIMSAISLAPIASFATTYSPPSASAAVLSKICFVKAQLPASLQISDQTNGIKIVNSSNSPIKLFIKNQEKIEMPSTLKPNHLPVFIKKNGFDFENHGTGFFRDKYKYRFNSNKNPLIETIDTSLVGKAEKALQSFLVWKSDQAESDTKIPFNYYIGNKLVINELKIYTRVKSEYNFTGVHIYKIEPKLPLPPGMIVASDNRAFQPDKGQLYYHIQIEYSGPETIIFYKELKSQIEDFSLVKTSFFPFLSSKNGSCFNLYNDDNRCTFYDHTFQSVFSDSENDSFTETRPAIIDLPADEIATINMLYQEKMTSINIIKHYVVNREWMPIYKKKDVLMSCSINCPDPKVAEKTIDYLKETKVNYPNNTFKDSELICTKTRD